jgi:D-alanyl-lipoteichoic acid acyltransferase DltB (MBOAT superfamily)
MQSWGVIAIGSSFYILQAIGYITDVFRNTVKPERNILRFGLFLGFFPKFTAGPIEEAKRFLPQLQYPHRFDYDKGYEGFKMILWGWLYKSVIADRLAIFVNYVFTHLTEASGPSLIAAAYGFTFQIYYDFAGYSLMAIGLAKLLGFQLSTNFRFPFLAQSPADFWRRWHITFYAWLRDYLYVPLGGNRTTGGRRAMNILLIFIISGLWHGLKFTFIAWGGMNAFLIIISTAVASWIDTLRRPLHHYSWIRIVKTVVTFHLIVTGFIIFRSASLSECWYFLTHMHLYPKNGMSSLFISDFGPDQWGIALSFIILTQFFEATTPRYNWPGRFDAMHYAVKGCLFTLLILLILWLGMFDNNHFIYAQF